MIPPPPKSTLFPYTTLFRSIEQGYSAGEPYHGYFFKILKGEGPAAPLGEIDRKSTRLNSSHRCISYAVFCLKKKNNQPTAASILTFSPNCNRTRSWSI